MAERERERERKARGMSKHCTFVVAAPVAVDKWLWLSWSFRKFDENIEEFHYLLFDYT